MCDVWCVMCDVCCGAGPPAITNAAFFAEIDRTTPTNILLHLSTSAPLFTLLISQTIISRACFPHASAYCKYVGTSDEQRLFHSRGHSMQVNHPRPTNHQRPPTDHPTTQPLPNHYPTPPIHHHQSEKQVNHQPTTNDHPTDHPTTQPLPNHYPTTTHPPPSK